MKHNTITLEFITGLSFGIEFFTGDALMPGDNFAMTIDLGILRLCYVNGDLD